MFVIQIRRITQWISDGSKQTFFAVFNVTTTGAYLGSEIIFLLELQLDTTYIAMTRFVLYGTYYIHCVGTIHKSYVAHVSSVSLARRNANRGTSFRSNCAFGSSLSDCILIPWCGRARRLLVAGAIVAQLTVAEREGRPVVVQDLHGLHSAWRLTALQFPHRCQLKSNQLCH